MVCVCHVLHYVLYVFLVALVAEGAAAGTFLLAEKTFLDNIKLCSLQLHWQ